MSVIRRQIIDIDGRCNHLRYAGSGPPVVLLHQSPQTSATMVELMQDLGSDFLVIAPDTPGFGLSDLLDVEYPTIPDLADNLHVVLASVGITRAMVMGVHTGAMIGLALADQYPDSVSHLVLDGLPVFTGEEQAHIHSGYFEPNPPRWDGSHLIRLWERINFQSVFFPWFDHRAEARLALDSPSMAGCQGYIHDYLYAGEEYRVGYQAAFEWDSLPAARRLSVPCHILCRDGDPLQLHAPRLTELPDGVQIEDIAMAPEVVRARVGEIFATAQQPSAVPAFEPAPHPGIQFSGAGQERWRVEIFGDQQGQPDQVLVLHDPGSSIEGVTYFAGQVEAALDHNADRGIWPALVVPDLPGHGESPAGLAESMHPSGLAAALSQEFLAAGNTVGVIAVGGSAAIAGYLAELHPGLPIALHQPLCPADPAAMPDPNRYWPPMTVVESGAHLLAAWRRLRSRDLYFPWYENNLAHAIKDGSVADALWLQQQLFDLLRSGKAAEELWQAVLTTDIQPVLDRSVGCVTGLTGRPESSGVSGLLECPDLSAAAQHHARWIESWLAASRLMDQSP